MKMLRKIIVFFAIFFITPYYFAFANLQINEIMYDLKTGSDEGREWVEIYNDSDTPVDLSSFRFFEADTNHKIKLAQGDTNVGAHGYTVIVSNLTKFKTDWPDLFVGPIFVSIFDSTFSLSNSGETLAIKNIQQDGSSTVVDQYAYNSSLGGAGDGKSLQKINGAWLAATPTPGAENKIIFTPPPVFKSEKITPKVSTKPKNLIQEITTPTPVGVSPPPQGGEDPSPPNVGGVPERGGGFIFIIILILLLGASAGAVYFIRRKNHISSAGDDFEILGE